MTSPETPFKLCGTHTRARQRPVLTQTLSAEEEEEEASWRSRAPRVRLAGRTRRARAREPTGASVGPKKKIFFVTTRVYT